MHLTRGPASHRRRNRQRASQVGHSHAGLALSSLPKKYLGYLSRSHTHMCTCPELRIPFSHFGPTASSPSSKIQRPSALIDMGLLTLYVHLRVPNGFGARSARASTSVEHAQIPPYVWWKVKKGADYSLNPSLTAWIIINNNPLASERCRMPLPCY